MDKKDWERMVRKAWQDAEDMEAERQSVLRTKEKGEAAKRRSREIKIRYEGFWRMPRMNPHHKFETVNEDELRKDM